MKAGGIGIKPKVRDEAMRCVEIIELFERQENALGMRKMSLSEPPDFDSIEIEGVMVSIQPDFLVHGPDRRVGAAMLRVAKAPDPAACKTEDGKDRRGHTRRELARYLVAEMQLLLEAQGGRLGTPDRDLCFVADVRLGERIGPCRRPCRAAAGHPGSLRTNRRSVGCRAGKALSLEEVTSPQKGHPADPKGASPLGKGPVPRNQ